MEIAHSQVKKLNNQLQEENAGYIKLFRDFISHLTTYIVYHSLQGWGGGGGNTCLHIVAMEITRTYMDSVGKHQFSGVEAGTLWLLCSSPDQDTLLSTVPLSTQALKSLSLHSSQAAHQAEAYPVSVA